ncbi:MAG: M23 family metallopeptidase [Candidatus Cloacimonetes bacterium]|nr:M23 family metallopeptidase [Candidatus Cloacimonadota bacterium]
MLPILLQRSASDRIMRTFKIIIFLLLPILLGAEDIFLLCGSPEQGGLMLGKVSNDVENVFFDYKPIQISDNQFFIGFDRDEKLNHIITFVLKNGEMISQKFAIKAQKYDIQEITLPKSKKQYYEKPDLELTARINSEARILRKTRDKIVSNERINICDKFSRAVIGGHISSVFGSQRIINKVPKRPHNGIDIVKPIGTPVMAMNAGIVALSGHYFYNGKFVLIDHGYGLSSIYIHLSENLVELGDSVQTGDIIGKLGDTGRSTGPHLHWGIDFNGKRLDPQLLDNMDEVFIRIRKDNE